MVNGTGLASGSIAGPGTCGGGRSVGGWRLVSTMSWWRLEVFGR